MFLYRLSVCRDWGAGEIPQGVHTCTYPLKLAAGGQVTGVGQTYTRLSTIQYWEAGMTPARTRGDSSSSQPGWLMYAAIVCEMGDIYALVQPTESTQHPRKTATALLTGKVTNAVWRQRRGSERNIWQAPNLRLFTIGACVEREWTINTGWPLAVCLCVWGNSDQTGTGDSLGEERGESARVSKGQQVT